MLCDANLVSTAVSGGDDQAVCEASLSPFSNVHGRALLTVGALSR